jgi:WD40 repeat protein
MNTRFAPMTLLAFAAMLLVSHTTSLAAEHNVEEQIVGPPWEQGTIYTLSPTGMHLGTMSAKGSRFIVTIDGVEGPAFDQILNAAGEFTIGYDFNFNPVKTMKWQGPVAFSPDGKRYAYAARTAKEIIVIADGKEIFHAPYSTSAPPVSVLSFTPDGKHVMFYQQTADTMQSFQLMMDGKPVTPPFDQVPSPLFSPDGRRWALLGSKPRSTNERFLIVDGKDAGYVASRLQFTPDSKRLVSVSGMPGTGEQALLIDGKPILTATLIDKVVVSPLGEIAAIAVPKGGQKKQLHLNGKPVHGTENAWNIVFSPDGKHWAASCAEAPSAWVVVDGKKQADYNNVRDIAFTGDSSKCVYVAETGVKKFVVINGEEDGGNNLIHVGPILSKTGNHVAYSAGEMMGKLKVHYNGVVQPERRNNFNLSLSPDGQHFVYYAANDAVSTELIVDGEVKGTAASFGGETIFSPDSKYVVTNARPPKGDNALFINGEFVSFPKGMGYPQALGFTANSRHLIFRGNESGPDNTPVNGYYVNGQRVAQFSPRGMTWANNPGHYLWEPQADGSVVFLGASPAPNNGYGPMKRVTVTPAAGSTIDTWVADVKAAEAKALADAAEAKKKAEQEAAAKAAKAKEEYAAAVAAKAKAREEALAVRKQALEEAAAAKVKARADALEAKKQAAAEAAAAKAKK